jgi:hypothetical protein
LAMQDLNLRCHFNPGNLFPLERYTQGFKALRPGAENLVVFSAIAGVPPDLVESQDYDAVDWRDNAQRSGFYDRVLNDPRMVEQVDPNRGPGGLAPSCSTQLGRTSPPIRLVAVAKGFGVNGSIHSLCQEDLSSAIDEIVERLGFQLGAPCLSRPLPRATDGQVGCNVIWELPAPGSAPESTPTACDAPGSEFLRPIGGGRSRTSERGGALCVVPQLPVRNLGGELRPEPAELDGTTFADGWYYDDFSESVAIECTASYKGRVAFTSGAKPPAGITVRLECLSELHVVDGQRPDQLTTEQQPRIGDACDSVQRNGRVLAGDEACAVRLTRATSAWPDSIDRSMFCHLTQAICAQSCAADSDCPEDWTCDDSAGAVASAGKSLCVPPECSVGAASGDGRRVGDPCLTDIVPQHGFDDREAYLGTGSADCGGGVCLVYRLRGDPRAGCIPRPANPSTGDPGKSCVIGSDVEQRVYCSCRCDAPEGFPECECPSEYTCVQALDQGGPELAGGYCVKNGTYVSQ